MGTIFEVARFRTNVIKPIVGDTDIKSADSIAQCQVELLGVGRGKTYTTPCRERQTFIADAECGLY